MESSASKAEAMKPLILKAGIPLAISMAGYIFARFLTLTNTSTNVSSSDNQLNSSEFNSDTGFPCKDGEEEMGLIENREIQEKHDFEDEISNIKARFEELQMREFELEMQFIRYRDLKQQESVLMELKSMLMVEESCIEFFCREVSSMESEIKRLLDLAILYLKLLEQIQGLRSENKLLQRKAKKLTRITKAQSRVLKEKNLKLGDRERELMGSLDEMETKNRVIERLEDEVKELEAAADQFKDENNEFLSILNSKSDMEYEGMTIRTEDYGQLLTEYENLRRDKADEDKELIYLRWSNACLRRDLIKIRGHQEQDQESKTHLDQMFKEENLEKQMHNDVASEQDEGCFGTVSHTCNSDAHHHVYSRRKRILKKLKKWVEGNEKGKSKLDERKK